MLCPAWNGADVASSLCAFCFFFVCSPRAPVALAPRRTLRRPVGLVPPARRRRPVNGARSPLPGVRTSPAHTMRVGRHAVVVAGVRIALPLACGQRARALRGRTRPRTGPPPRRVTRSRVALRKPTRPLGGHMPGGTPMCSVRRVAPSMSPATGSPPPSLGPLSPRPTLLKISGAGGRTCGSWRTRPRPGAVDPCLPAFLRLPVPPVPSGCATRLALWPRRGRVGPRVSPFRCSCESLRMSTMLASAVAVPALGAWRDGSGRTWCRRNGFVRRPACRAANIAVPCVACLAPARRCSWWGCSWSPSQLMGKPAGPPCAWPCVALRCTDGSCHSRGLPSRSLDLAWSAQRHGALRIGSVALAHGPREPARPASVRW